MDLWIRTQGVDGDIGSSLVKVSTLEIVPSRTINDINERFLQHKRESKQLYS